MNALKKNLMIVLGSLAIVIGAIGVALPILPTTPFIIIAALCFSTSSPKMYSWLSNNRYFGEYISNHRDKTGVTKKTKAYSITFLWTLLIVSMFFMKDNTWMLILLIIVGLVVTVHIMLLRGRVTCKTIK